MLIEHAIRQVLTAAAEQEAAGTAEVKTILARLTKDYQTDPNFRRDVDLAARMALRAALECIAETPPETVN